jgi:hypothetical protein
MKKYILTIALAIGFGMNLNAQIGQSGKSDSFFSSNKYSEYRDETAMGTMPLLPGHNTLKDYDADPKQVPVGSGLLLLAGLGLGYASLRKVKSEN